MSLLNPFTSQLHVILGLFFSSQFLGFFLFAFAESSDNITLFCCYTVFAYLFTNSATKKISGYLSGEIKVLPFLVLITLAAQSSFYILRRLCTWWQTRHTMEATLLQDRSKQLCPFFLWCNQHLCQNDEVVKPAYYPFKLQKTSSWNDPSWVKTSWNSASALKLTLWWLWLMVFVTLGCPLDALSDKGELNIYPNGRGIKAGWWVTVM